MNKKIERIVENNYGYSHTKTIYYCDGSYEMVNLRPFKSPLEIKREKNNK